MLISNNHKNFKKHAMLPTNDYIFKRIFGHVGNENLTKSFLESILHTNISSICLDINPILEKNLLDDKIGILDIKATLNHSITCDIEMQVARYEHIAERLLFYWSKIFSSNLKESEDYSTLSPVIGILIGDFSLDKLRNIPKYHTLWHIRESDFSKIILTRTLELHIIELQKLKKLLKNKENIEENDLTRWLKFIINPDKLKEADMKSNVQIQKAKDIYDEIKQNEYEQRMAELRFKHILDSTSLENQGYRKGLKDGVVKGIAKGELNSKKDIAKKMLKDHLTIEQIHRLTGLSIQEIQKL